MKKVLITTVFAALLSLNLTACQQGFTQDQVDKLMASNEDSKESALERELYVIHMSETLSRNQIYGENIPAVFQSLSLPANDLTAYSLPTNSKYIYPELRLVKDLKIGCDGTISYTRNYNLETSITWEQFLYAGHWRAENLFICGKLEIPEGRRLIILATKTTLLQDIQFSTQKNALLSLILKNTQYEGATPLLNVSPHSIISFKFE